VNYAAATVHNDKYGRHIFMYQSSVV